MVELLSQKHTRTRSHGAHERTSWEAPKSVGGEAESTRESTTTTTCRPDKCDSAARLPMSMSMSMCRGRPHHTYLLQEPAYPTLPRFYSAPYYCEARSSSAFALHLSVCLPVCLPLFCLSCWQADFHSRVCLASPLSSVFCAAQLHARAHRSGIFRPSSVSSLAVPVDQQPGKLPPSCSNCRLLSELLL